MVHKLPDLGTIVGIWAHPDDESYTSAGIMAHAVRAGRRVVCVTATRGEEGSWDEIKWPHGDGLATTRESELRKALEILGVNDIRLLEYHDGDCARVDVTDAVAKLAEIIADVKPDSVLTFGPDGLTNHPDHKAVSRWATEAFQEAAPKGSRLYYATMTQEWVDKYLDKLNQFNVFPDGPPPVTPDQELAISFLLPPVLKKLKLQALAAHVSQHEGMLAAWGPDFLDEGHRQEVFRLAATS